MADLRKINNGQVIVQKNGFVIVVSLYAGVMCKSCVTPCSHLHKSWNSIPSIFRYFPIHPVIHTLIKQLFGNTAYLKLRTWRCQFCMLWEWHNVYSFMLSLPTRQEFQHLSCQGKNDLGLMVKNIINTILEFKSPDFLFNGENRNVGRYHAYILQFNNQMTVLQLECEIQSRMLC